MGLISRVSSRTYRYDLMEKGKERLFSFKTSGLTKSINLIKEVEFRIVLPRIFRKNNKLNKFNGSSSVNSSIRSVESSNSVGSFGRSKELICLRNVSINLLFWNQSILVCFI